MSLLKSIRDNNPFRYKWENAPNANNPFLAFANVGIKTMLLLPLLPFAFFGLAFGGIIDVFDLEE